MATKHISSDLAKEASFIALITRQTAEGKLDWTESTPSSYEVKLLTGGFAYGMFGTPSRKFEVMLGDVKLVLLIHDPNESKNLLVKAAMQQDTQLFVLESNKDSPSMRLHGAVLAELQRIVAQGRGHARLLDSLIEKASSL